MPHYFDESIFTGDFKFDANLIISNVSDQFLCDYYNIDYKSKSGSYALNPSTSLSVNNIYSVGLKPYMNEVERVYVYPISVVDDKSTNITILNLNVVDPDKTYTKGLLNPISSAILIKWYATMREIKITNELYQFIYKLLPEVTFNITMNEYTVEYKGGFLTYNHAIIDSKNKQVNTEIVGPELHLW